MPIPRPVLILAALLPAIAAPALAQEAAPSPDTARAEIRGVLRTFYRNYQQKNWDALAAYVLSPKLLERRGAPGDSQVVARDRTRDRASLPRARPPEACPASESPMIEDAVITLDGDWAEVSVPRCEGSAPGVDEFGMLWFEARWRFIYTDLFEGAAIPETARR